MTSSDPHPRRPATTTSTGRDRIRLRRPAVVGAGARRRLRRLLRRVHRESAPPPLAILEGLWGLFDARVLGVCVELGIPELLDRPRRPDELAAVVGADPDALRRLLRFAASRGFVTARPDGLLAANRVTRHLRRDHPGGWVDVVRRANTDWYWDAWRHLPTALGVEIAPDDAVTPPEIDVAGTRLQAEALADDLPWESTRTICDVGGGTGVALERLLERHAHLHGVLLDRGVVIAEARQALRKGPLSARSTLVEGDFFAAVPPACDRYLLMAIMTECTDEQATAVLSRVAAVLEPASAVLVVDNVLSDRPTDEVAQVTDLLLLALGVGRERTRAEYEAVFASAGLTVRAAHRLSTGSTAFELVARPAVDPPG